MKPFFVLQFLIKSLWFCRYFSIIGVIMKNLILSLILCFSTVASAYDLVLKNSLDYAKKLYNDKTYGQDYNYIRGKIYPSNKYLLTDKRIINKQIFSPQFIKNAISTCAFMKEGANSNHLNLKEQRTIANKFYKHLLRIGRRGNTKPEFFLVYNYSFERSDLDSPCSIYIHYVGRGSLLMNSHSMRYSKY